MQTTDDDEHLPCLPQEVILENILTRLPVKTLIVFGSVCKLWYNSIHHDTRFASSHFLHSQNNPRLMFSVFNVKDNSHENSLFDNYFFFLSEDYDEEGDRKVEVSRRHRHRHIVELVGSCHGLICLLLRLKYTPIIEIYHPGRHEKLFIHVPFKEGRVICYGFGIDSLRNEYKVILFFYRYDEFKCKVYTLGTNSWRTITFPASTNQILHSPDYKSRSPAIFCDGALFWRATKQTNYNLLLFDLNEETFQVIQLPTECVSLLTTTNEIHLMELNGSLCVASLDKILQTDENNRIRCMVHLHILKDRVKQVWIKETLLSSDLSPRPCLYNTNTTHIMSFSGRVLLYWFNGKHVQFYDLVMKHLNLVDLSLKDDQIFEGKLLSKAELCTMDYQLKSHIENFISLQTFLPEGAHRYDIREVDDSRFLWNHGGVLVYLSRTSRAGILGIPTVSLNFGYLLLNCIPFKRTNNALIPLWINNTSPI